MTGADQDKTDPASAYKLQKARERGSVSKSQELTFVVILFGMTCCVFGMGRSVTGDLSRVFQGVLVQASREVWTIATVSHLLGDLTQQLTYVLAPPMVAIMALAVLASVLQVGFVVSAQPLKPDFSRINPATGLKRLFSMRSIYELIRSSIKFTLVAALVAAALHALINELIGLSHREVSGIVDYGIHGVGKVLAALTALFALFAVADVVYTRWDFLKQMRMSKREVKDEYKQREGDPRVKSRIRELRIEWLKKSRALSRVKNADVLITNPTHVAIALAYKRDAMSAPRVLAKGAGDVAAKMRTMARQHHVMVVENAPLARALYRLTEPDDYVPESHYAEVAKILVWVFAARRLQAGARTS